VNVGYRVGGTIVDVEADDHRAGAWLTEFLTPWAEVVPHGVGAWRVRLTTSDARHAALVERRPADARRPVPCYALDKGVVHLPGWDDDEGTVAVDDELGYALVVAEHAVEVVAREGRLRARAGLMRVVRELLASPVLANDPSVVDLHAAAFVLDGGAVLVAGHKQSGKTTVLTHALASGGASLLANDRVMVRGGADGAMATGVPTLVSVRPWTVELYPALRVHADERPAFLSRGETQDAVVSEYGPGERAFAMSPALFARRLCARQVRCAPVTAVVFPALSPHTRTWTFDEVPTDEAERLLRACVYGAGAERPRTVFEGPDGPGTRRGADVIAAIERVVAGPRLVQAVLGPEAYAASAHAWFDALGLAPAQRELLA